MSCLWEWGWGRGYRRVMERVNYSGKRGVTRRVYKDWLRGGGGGDLELCKFFFPFLTFFEKCRAYRGGGWRAPNRTPLNTPLRVNYLGRRWRGGWVHMKQHSSDQLGSWARIISRSPSTKLTICIFKLTTFKCREGIVFRTNLAT